MSCRRNWSGRRAVGRCGRATRRVLRRVGVGARAWRLASTMSGDTAAARRGPVTLAIMPVEIASAPNPRLRCKRRGYPLGLIVAPRIAAERAAVDSPASLPAQALRVRAADRVRAARRALDLHPRTQ